MNRMFRLSAVLIMSALIIGAGPVANSSSALNGCQLICTANYTDNVRVELQLTTLYLYECS